MGVTVLWDNEEKTTLRVDLAGSWSWGDYDRALAEAGAIMRSGGQHIDVIHNLLEGSRAPLGYVLPHFQRAMQLMEDNVGCIVIVGSNYSMNLLLSLFLGTFTTVGRKVAFVDSVDEARHILGERRLDQDKDRRGPV